MKLRKPLSPRQQRIYRFVVDYWLLHGYGPTTRDIMAGADISSTSVVVYNVQHLCARGLLAQHEDIRSLRPMHLGHVWQDGRLVMTDATREALWNE